MDLVVFEQKEEGMQRKNTLDNILTVFSVLIELWNLNKNLIEFMGSTPNDEYV